jgi:predicted transcriptional regulator
MANKVTKKDNFKALYTMVENSNVANKMDLLGFIDHEIELLEKKASAKTQTKTQKENMGIKDIIVDIITENGEPMTISMILEREEMSGYTNQKISALCKQLVDNGVLKRVEDKRKTYFALAD